ncbi:MAG: GAF domain-containing protein [Gammaproteobacteria bacterium]|nr:GAF domain-containing protein [Gammaproteobacteria bacterium]
MNISEKCENVKNFIDSSLPLVSNLSNLATYLYDEFKGTSWFGFYLVLREKDVLYLGPYRGPLACTKIPFKKGVCGEAAFYKKSILVDDVTKYHNYIACSSLARSEIVVPIIKNDEVLGVIDLDSDNYSNYDEEDVILLEEIANIIKEFF